MGGRAVGQLFRSRKGVRGLIFAARPHAVQPYAETGEKKAGWALVRGVSAAFHVCASIRLRFREFGEGALGCDSQFDPARSINV